jgi:hypothetical protein
MGAARTKWGPGPSSCAVISGNGIHGQHCFECSQQAHWCEICGGVVCSYWDQSKVEVNIAKQKNPLIGKIVSCARMVGPSAPGETCNIIIDHGGNFS